MSIERIKEDAAKADQLIAELAKGAEAPVVETPAVEPEAAQPEVVQPDQGVVTAATEDPGTQALAQLREDAAKWEQRYRSLDGMIQARDRQIEQLHQLIAGMQQAQQAMPQESAPEPKQKGKLVTEKDEDTFGADLVDMARRVTREEQNAYTEALERRLAQLEQSLQGVTQTTAVTAQERFEAKLTEAVPSWRQIDADQGFIAWLQSSPTRNKLFAEAARTQEVADVAYFFKEYASAQQPPAVADAAAATARANLEKQVAPGKSKAGPTPAQHQAEKKVWTRSEIAGVYGAKKQYAADEFARLERDIAAAQREGRVDYAR